MAFALEIPTDDDELENAPRELKIYGSRTDHGQLLPERGDALAEAVQAPILFFRIRRVQTKFPWLKPLFHTPYRSGAIQYSVLRRVY